MPVIINQTAKFDVGLAQVTRPAQAAAKYGPQKITRVQKEGIEKYYFEDNLISVLWEPVGQNMGFLLKNKTEHSIHLIWDEAIFSDEKGVSHRVIHSGTKLNERNSPQAATPIGAQDMLSDIIYPSDYADWTGSEWSERPILPIQKRGASEKIVETNVDPEELAAEQKQFREAYKKDLESYIGKTLKVVLPIKIKDVVNEYAFSFQIRSASVVEDTVSGQPKQ
jgi:hypothetical protein